MRCFRLRDWRHRPKLDSFQLNARWQGCAAFRLNFDLEYCGAKLGAGFYKKRYKLTTAPSLTQLLNAWRAGDAAAPERLVPQIYVELRAIAAQQFRRASDPSNTLQPTALVHEAWLRMGEGNREFTDRKHFFALAALTMRGILVDRARAAQSAKRGGLAKRVTLSPGELALSDDGEELLLLHEALAQLAVVDRRSAQVLELHYFGGLERLEVAELLGVSQRTVDRSLSLGRAWLARALV